MEDLKIEIDFAFAVGSRLLLGGWAVVGSNMSTHPLQFDGEPASQLLLYKREDVSQVMQCPSEHCSGFLVVLSDATNKSSVDLSWGDDYCSIEITPSLYTTLLAEISPLPQNLIKDATALLERNGFYWGQKALEFDENTPNNLSLSHKDSKIQIDYTYTLDANTILLIGWVLDEARLFKRINLRINNIITNCILKDAFFHPRYDVAETLKLPLSQGEKIGFAFTVSLPEQVNPDVELMYSVDGVFFQGQALKAEQFKREETWLTEILLTNVDITNTAKFPKLAKHVNSAIEKCWRGRLEAPNSALIKQFGASVENSDLSLIIPIYGRYDFVQIQMSQFSLDPDFDNIEIVYVLDDPRIKHAFMVTCQGVFETFGVPFKIVLSERNLGYAGANNLGVAHASAEYIVLLNSDVIPKQIGQFSALLSQFVENDNMGILSGTLLYEDNTIQHQGMEYMQDPSHPGMWMNYHPQKGFPLSLTDEFDIRDAQAVTGALMLMTKQQYIDVGGFDIGYILGDFEDSDLCMKVRNQNKRIAVSGVVQMYHLERLSQSLVSGNTWKHTLSMLNGLRHTNKWNDRIVEVMAENG
ncbi:glycosyltransferase family 2 protein [Alteromonas sp. KS69]|jgi:GT2 family glycosyltransferase|uniref:glycosyltransferase family 2 protein n=1 Tax=Alteromonas sp. KS69 TaxID=2109917 RepID=UPI000F8996E9|nr:glycosyltransferase [Alteromonas sp. KS69]RUP83091.1 glycosyltransferase family 2 protein [Alteromonas sp. KS69]